MRAEYPPGSNNRLVRAKPPVPIRLLALLTVKRLPQDEGGGNRNNNNRLMDTQNNAKGGYGYGGDANNKVRFERSCQNPSRSFPLAKCAPLLCPNLLHW